MTTQLSNKTNEINIRYLYQGSTDKPVMERKIYSEALETKILNQEIFQELEDLYLERNKMIHRYIISEFRTRQLIEIAYRYESACENVRLIMRDIEDKQFEAQVGIYGNGQHPHRKATNEYIKLLHSQVNDKHLLADLERKIKASIKR